MKPILRGIKDDTEICPDGGSGFIGDGGSNGINGDGGTGCIGDGGTQI